MEINQRRWTRRVYTEWQGNLLTGAVTFCLHYAKSRHDFPSRVTLPPRATRGWPKSMVERRWPGTQQSSITIGNKSKADATGCLQGNLPPRRFFSPPADNTTVFNKYKTIHETDHPLPFYIYTPLAPSSNSSRLFGFLSDTLFKLMRLWIPFSTRVPGENKLIKVKVSSNEYIGSNANFFQI